MDDQTIILLYEKRDEDAILHTQRKYGSACHRIAANILGNDQDAEECVNDSYLKVWNSIPPAKPQSFFAFLSRIVRNISLDRYRYNHAERRDSGADILLSELEGCLSDTELSDVGEDRIVEALNGFLETLDQKTRILFVRRYWYMDSNEMLAKRFSTNENTVRQKLYRTREKLREYLRKEGIGI